MTPFERLQLVESQIKLDFGIEEKRAYARASKNLDAFAAVEADFQKYRKSRLAGVTLATLPVIAAKKAADSALDDNNAPIPGPAPDPIGDTIKVLEEGLQKLKKLLPAGDNTGDDDVEEAKAATASGLASKALTALSRATEKVGAKIQAVKFAALSPVAKMSHGFMQQPAVAALAASLSSPAKRAAVALAPVGGSRAEIIKPTTVGAIQAEIKRNDDEQRKFGFDNARHSKHLKLSAQLDLEIRKSRRN